MTDDFTKAEKAAIRAAYAAVEHACNRCAWEYAPRLRDAFRFEKRECTNEDWARSLICEEFLRGAAMDEPASSLFRLQDGARMAHMLGAAMADRYNARAVDLLHVLEIAHGARKAAEQRRLDRICSK